MKITTWNINGIRAAFGKNAFDWLNDFKPDILCLQEIKAKEDQIDGELFTQMGYQSIWNPAERPDTAAQGLFIPQNR